MAFEISQMTNQPTTLTKSATATANIKETQWATKTCKYLYETKGCIPLGEDPSFVNTVCGSNDNLLIASGDKNGLINLFRNPVTRG